MTTNVSAVVKHFPVAQDGFATTSSGSISAGATTVGLNSTGDYADGDTVALIIDADNADKKQAFTGDIDVGGSQVVNVKWTSGTDQAHSGGATVVDYETATAWSMIAKGLLVAHNQDGTLNDTAMGRIWPVGSVYINAAVATNPADLLGFGTWTAFGSGRVPVGFDSGQTEFDTLGETGGAKTHTLSIAEMPAHDHQYTGPTQANESSGATPNGVFKNATLLTSASTGGGGAHNNLQPYIVVYMWQRTA